MLQNVPQVAIAVHATWHCGGIVTTVNPMYKERELRHQLADSGARIVVCLESLFGVVEAAREGTAVEHVVTVSELDMLDTVPAALAGHERIACPGAIAFEDLVSAGRARSRRAEVAPGSPAFLTYTSGTTGVPKGAINTHEAIVHNAEVMTRWWSLGPGDVTVAMAPLFHITGLVCHLATARASMTPLLLLHRFEAGEILRLIERWRGTYIIGPLTAFVAMLEHPSFAERDLSSLTKVASGGAPVYPGGGRALGARDRRLSPQHLRADRDRRAVASRAGRGAGAGRPGERRAVGGRAHPRHGLEGGLARRRPRAGARARWARS